MKQLSRREVIKTLALGSVCAAVPGKAWSGTVALGLRPLSHEQRGLLVVRLVDFPELNQPLGSVRLTTSALVPAPGGGQKHSGLFPPILINRGEAGELHVLSADCTHEGCAVRELDPVSKLVLCSCVFSPHGSRYRIDGAVARGPARTPLQKFDFVEREGVIEVELPNTFFEVKAERVESAGRLLFSFLALERITYEVYFRATLDAPLERVNFALTPSGALDRTEFVGPTDGTIAVVYLEANGGAGFYQVAMKTTAV